MIEYVSEEQAEYIAAKINTHGPVRARDGYSTASRERVIKIQPRNWSREKGFFYVHPDGAAFESTGDFEAIEA